jgi:hypothetical protein
MIPVTIARNFLSRKCPDQLLGPTSLPTWQVPGTKLPAHDTDHSLPPRTGSSVPFCSMLFCFITLFTYFPKSLFILLSGHFQVHRFPLLRSYPPDPLLLSPLHSTYLLGWPYLLTSKWKKEGSSKMSVPVYQATGHHSQEERNLSYLKHWSCYTNQEDNNRSSRPVKHVYNLYHFENRQTPN